VAHVLSWEAVATAFQIDDTCIFEDLEEQVRESEPYVHKRDYSNPILFEFYKSMLDQDTVLKAF
jgi:hypothetical protein